jgi:hypothetical protein
MLPNHFKQLIQKLGDKTKSQNAHWLRTSGENEYKLQLKGGEVITIDKWLDKRQNYRVEMMVYNTESEVIDRVTFTEHDQEFIILDQFYDVVRRSFFKIDSTFQKIIQEIEAETQVGFKADT